jgi:hypothetical protein
MDVAARGSVEVARAEVEVDLERPEVVIPAANVRTTREIEVKKVEVGAVEVDVSKEEAAERQRHTGVEERIGAKVTSAKEEEAERHRKEKERIEALKGEIAREEIEEAARSKQAGEEIDIKASAAYKSESERHAVETGTIEIGRTAASELEASRLRLEGQQKFSADAEKDAAAARLAAGKADLALEEQKRKLRELAEKEQATDVDAEVARKQVEVQKGLEAESARELDAAQRKSAKAEADVALRKVEARSRQQLQALQIKWSKVTVEDYMVIVKGQNAQGIGVLVDEQIEFVGGVRDKLIGVLQQRYGYRREVAGREVDDWRVGMKKTLGKQ